MAHIMTFYPIGNAETCLLELENKTKILFDYASVYTGDENDDRYDIQKELSKIEKFNIVMFSHAHKDHTKGASDFFYLDHAKKYQSDDRKKFDELWVSSAFLIDTDLEAMSDAKIIRNEARYRLKNGYGIKVFAEPSSLSDWLEQQEIDYEDVKHLIVHAGQIIEDKAVFGENVQIFVHAPFSKDSEEVQDKNDPSIVLQVRLENNKQITNILITGDTPHEILDKIVDISKSNKNEDRLSWDVYDIPHHCSYTGLNEKEDDKVIPTENVKWLLEQSCKNAIMIASCDKITDVSSPPHLIAKEAYIQNTKDDVKFYSTMEHLDSGKPTPIVLNIDQFGVTVKSSNISKEFVNRYAPRAGMNEV